MRLTATGILVAFLSAGCGGIGRPKVGVVPRESEQTFWQTFHAGTVKAANESGLEVEWAAPAAEISSSRQIAIVEGMIRRRLAGIVLAAVNPRAMAPIIAEAEKAGIPVALVASEVDVSGVSAMTTLSFDYRDAGRRAAQQLGTLMRGEGKAALAGFASETSGKKVLHEAFAQELKTSFPNITLLTSLSGQVGRSQARDAAESLLTSHPDLAGLFADNELSAAGAALELRARATTQVRVVAFGAGDQLVGELRDRFIDQLIVPDPMQIGYEAVKAVAMKREGQQPPPKINCPVYQVDRSNIEDPDIVKVLYPDLKRYLDPDGRR